MLKLASVGVFFGASLLLLLGSVESQTVANATRAPLVVVGHDMSCSTGNYLVYNSAAKTTTCTVCPAGSACAGGVTPIKACTPGQYSNAGASTCTNCPSGYICATTSSAPVLCTAGHTCPMMTFGSDPPNCPQGYYCPDPDLDPIPCPCGFYNNDVGCEDISCCFPTPPNSWCPSACIYPSPCATGCCNDVECCSPYCAC